MRVLKQPGERWLVMLRQGGGQLEVAEKDDAVFDSEEGLIVYHNDGGKTVTFAPKEGIGFIRSYHPSGTGGFSKNRSQNELGHAPTVRPPTTPVIDVEATRELEVGSWASDDKVVERCPDCHHLNVVHNDEVGCVICWCRTRGRR